MCTVHIGIRHDDDAVVAKLVRIEVIPSHAAANARSQRRDERQDFIARQQLFVARLFHIEDLAAQRQDRLELAISSLLGRTASGIALDDVDLTQRRILLLAVRQFAGQPHAVQDALAPRHLARLACGLPSARCIDDLSADDLRVDRVLFKILAEGLADDIFYRAAHLAADQFVLGLAGKFRLGHLDRQDATQAFAQVIAGNFDLGLLGHFVVVNVLVYDPRHRRTQAGQM